MDTQNLIIRQFTPNDLKDFTDLIRDKMSSEYSSYDEPFPTDNEGLKSLLGYFAVSDEFFAVEIKTEKRVIGFISLNYVDDSTRNLGYCIHSDYQSNGYASEAVMKIKDYAKDYLKLHKLISGTAEENIPSVNLLKRMGFTLVSKTEGSFMNDDNGKPIVFIGCSFECIL